MFCTFNIILCHMLSICWNTLSLTHAFTYSTFQLSNNLETTGRCSDDSLAYIPLTSPAQSFSLLVFLGLTAQNMKFPIIDFFSKCDQIRRKLRIWSHLLKKCLMENFIFQCSVSAMKDYSIKAN